MKSEESKKMYYFSDMVNEQGYDAGTKARTDIEDLLRNRYMALYPYSDEHKGKIEGMFIFLKTVLNTDKSDIIIVQYPLIRYKKLLRIVTKVRKCIILIHDLQSLRIANYGIDEMKMLRGAYGIISHNVKMTEYLKSKNIKCNIFELEVFDYLCDEKSNVNHFNDESDLCFAGNLGKSGFLKKLPATVLENGIDLFGKGYDEETFENMKYCGAYEADIIHKMLTGKFGLIWDGEDITTCKGLMGNYLQYNNPHKLSMYIVANMPVITWKKAAIANFIEKNNIGFTVNSIEEIPERIKAITKSEYNEFVYNLKKIADKIAVGNSFLNILNEIEIMCD